MRPRSPVEGSSPAGTILNSEPLVVWVEGSDKRKPTNGLVLKLFYDKETDQWVSPDDMGSLVSRDRGNSHWDQEEKVWGKRRPVVQQGREIPALRELS